MPTDRESYEITYDGGVGTLPAKYGMDRKTAMYTPYKMKSPTKFTNRPGSVQSGQSYLEKNPVDSEPVDFREQMGWGGPSSTVGKNPCAACEKQTRSQRSPKRPLPTKANMMNVRQEMLAGNQLASTPNRPPGRTADPNLQIEEQPMDMQPIDMVGDNKEQYLV